VPLRTLAELIGPDRLVRLQGKTKAEVLDELVAVLARAPEVRDAEAAGRLKTELRRAGLDLESGADGRLVLLPVAEVPEAGGQGEPSDA